MTARQLLSDLRRAGVVLSVNGDRLAFDAPVGAMTPDRLAMLRACKAKMMAEIQMEDPVGRQITAQLESLVPWTTVDGRVVLVNPRQREELDRVGLL